MAISRSLAVRRIRLVALVLALALVSAACGGGGEEGGTDTGAATEPAAPATEPADTEPGQETAAPTETEPAEAGATATEGGDAAEGETIEIAVSPSGTPVFVAADQGFFEGVNVEVSQVGYDQSAALFLAGDSPLGWIAPIEVAEFVSQGEEFRYFNTAGALNMINGLVVRAEDAEQYQSIDDLVGQRVGNPGFGTGTWATFEVIADSQYDIQPREDFENVTADVGALLGLLETGEIEAALLFAGQSAAALASEEFETIFSFTGAWQESTGHPMVVNGPVARASWLEENAEAAARIVEGIDRAVAWIADNTDQFREGGQYESWAESEGWLTTPETIEGVVELLEQGEWYLTSDAYTEEWIDSIYSLVEAGEGSLVEEVPPRDDIFFPPAQLPLGG